jgi:hypothetical protein
VREGVDDARQQAVDDSPGARLGRRLGRATASLGLNVLLLGTKFVPGGWKFWRAWTEAGYKGMLKRTGDDYGVIGHITVGDQIKHVPLRYDYEDAKLYNENGDSWNVAAEGDNTYRVGSSVPAVWASDRSNEIGSHVQAEVAEALDLGAGRDVFRDAQVKQEITIDAQAVGEGAAEGQAMADGGQSQISDLTFDVRDPGTLHDQLIPLDAGLSESDRGRVVSMEKYYQTYPSVVDPEEMKRQEEVGRIAEMDDDKQDFVVKILLIALGFVAVSLGVFWLLTSGAASSVMSGGGGSLLPGLLAPFVGGL